MIQLKDKVTHLIHGVGIVERLENNESIATVDFKGKMHKCEVSLLQKGANTYKPKRSAEELLKNTAVKIERLQNKYSKRFRELDELEVLSHPQLVEYNCIKGYIVELEKILQKESPRTNEG